MESYCMEFEKTNTFSQIFLDYINRDEKLKPFYHLYPNIENFARQIELKKNFKPHQRQVLAQALQNQYSHLKEIPQDQIDLLAQENTFTVTTGHQLSLFTGPLYFVFKIITTINLANELKKNYPDYNFVPVYWMATEDHDFEEINHFHLFGKKFEWQSEQKGAVGRFKTEGIEQIFAQISEQLPLFEAAYLENANLANATRQLVNELFGKYGLVCIDGDDRLLKSQFEMITFEEIYKKNSFRLVNETNAKLSELKYPIQVNPREINFFYLEDGLRERIVVNEEEDVFEVLNSDLKFDTKLLLEHILGNYPERFSPNVILRPLYQETILPNLAYIGGPGELAYWLQLKSIFDFYETPFPFLFPRNFGMLLNQANLKKMEKLNLSKEAIFQSEQVLKENFVQQNSQNEINLDTELTAIEQIFKTISQKAMLADKSLEGFVGAEAQKTFKSIETIQKRLKKAEESKLETELKQIAGLKEKLFPNHTLQERHDNILNFLINQPDLIDKLMQQFEPFDFRMNVLEV